jgi:hypothetical protein
VGIDTLSVLPVAPPFVLGEVEPSDEPTVTHRFRYAVEAEDVREQVISPAVYRGEQFVGLATLPAGVEFTPTASGLRFAIGGPGEAPTVEVTDVADESGVVEVVDTDEIRVTIEEEATATLAVGRLQFTLYGAVGGQPKVFAAGVAIVRKGAGSLPAP